MTRLCLKASRRLPLNAPTLALRLTRKTPDDIIELAAKSLKAGGAHPILLNDEKLIEGLKHCGDGIGSSGEGWENWDSEVTLEDARNYACDGCYEAQIVGKNWFTLGGFPTPTILECTINMGKTYSSAGTVWFTG